MAKMTIKQTVSFDMTSIVDVELMKENILVGLANFDLESTDPQSKAILTRVTGLMEEEKFEEAFTFLIKHSLMYWLNGELKGVTLRANAVQRDKFSPVSIKPQA